MRIIIACAWCCWLLTAAEPSAPVYDEIDVLARMNLLRSDFQVGKACVVNAIRSKRVKAVEYMWEGGDADMKQTTRPGPLVFSPVLNDVARTLLKAGELLPDKCEYDARPAARAAGYSAADKPVTAILVTGASELELAFVMACTWVVEERGVPPSVSSRYAGHMMIRASWREVGIAVQRNQAGISMAIVMGQGSTARMAGGVAYRDANRNGQMDAGEGLAGVAVEGTDPPLVTGPGGAWWFGSNASGDLPVVLSIGDLRKTFTVAKDATSGYNSWSVPEPSALAAVDRLIRTAESAIEQANVSKREGALLSLLVGTRQYMLDDARHAAVSTLVEPVAYQYNTLLQQVLEALYEEQADAEKRIAAKRKTSHAALGAWFKEAAALPGLRQQVGEMSKATGSDVAKQAKPVIEQIRKAMAATQEPAFMSLYLNWLKQVEDHLPSAPAEPAKRKKP